MGDLHSDLGDLLRRDRDDIIKLCADLIRIPSENPPSDTRAVFHYVTGHLDRRGVRYELVTGEPSMPNLIASFDGGQGGRHLVLNAHLDVFPAGDPSLWSNRPFSGIVRDAKLLGRGSTDMKAGVAAAVLTYAYLSELRQHIRGKLTLTLVSDEESFGPWGARHLMTNRPEALGDCVLSGEPSTPAIVRFGERGLVWVEVRTTAVGGHGAYGHKNAIKEMTKIIKELDELAAIDCGVPPEVLHKIEAAREVFDGQLGPGATDVAKSVTVNIGRIEGGAKVNLAAAQCRAEIDVRCPIGVATDAILQKLEGILARHPGASYRIINRFEPNWSDPNHEMVRIIQRHAQRIRGIRPVPGLSLGCTDCRLWRYKGIPAIAYGPTPFNMGAPDEYITLDDLLGTVGVHVFSSLDYLMGAAE